jgi:tetratricopeptide (TPR) repeat protein
MMDQQTWERTAALFERALDVPGDQREAFVRREAADDPELIAAVLNMLRHDESANLLDQSVDTLATLLIDDADHAQDLEVGTRVGDYEILGVSGRGGIGVVYRARDVRLDRIAALKFLPTSHLSDAAAQRIEAEARAASALDHPNIATIYHVGTASDGRPFIAMAHYDGDTLAQRLERGPLQAHEAIRIAIAIAGGLEAAHERDIMHRDIKPSNVMLTTSGAVKLLDFGIAVVAGEYIAGPASGTRGYMSPEQLASTPSQPTSDVWSLGAVLHEMVTGQPPSAAERVKVSDMPELDAVLQRALARAPSERYRDIASMRAALEHVQSTLVSPAARMRRWSRVRISVGVVAGSALLLAGVLVMSPARARRAGDAPQPSMVAVFPFEVRGDSSLAYLREGMVDLLSAAFDGVGGLRSIDPRALRAGLEAEPSAVRDPRKAGVIAASLGAGRLILGTIMVTGDQLRATATLYDARGELAATAQSEILTEERIFDVVDQLAARLLTQQDSSGGELRRLAASTTASLPALKAYLEGEQAARSGRFEAAATAFDRAVALDTSFALANYGLASAQWWLDRSELARTPAARALRQAERLPRGAKLQLEGTLARLEGDLDRAEQIYRQLIMYSPNDAEAWYGLGDVMHHYNPVRGRPLSEAVPYFERALRLQPDNMSVRLHLANIAARHRNYARHDSLIASLPTNARFARFIRLVQAFATNDTGAQTRASREFREADDRILAEALHYIVRLAHNPAGGLRFLATVEQPGKDRRSVAYAHYLRGGLQLDMGRWSAARRELELADSLGNPSALPTIALWSLAPFVPPDTAAWRAWRARLEQRERALPAGETNDRATFACLRGLLSVRLGDVAGAARIADSLSAPGATVNARNRAFSIRAELARQRGQHAAALALLEQLSPQTSLDPVQDPPLANSYERFMRAELLRTLGRTDEAIGWYRGQQEASMLEAIYVAPSYLRSAQLLAARGDTTARAHERWYRDLWSKADRAVRAWR